MVAKNTVQQSGKIPLGADYVQACHRGTWKVFSPPFLDTQGCPHPSLKAGGLANILLGTERWVGPSLSRDVSLDLPPCLPSLPPLTTLVHLSILPANIY